MTKFATKPYVVALISFAAACSQAEGAALSLQLRQDQGECAKNASDEYFPKDYLQQYRLLGTTIGDLDNPIVSAEYIELNYGTNFKVLTEKFAKEQYILTQCGTSQPSASDVDQVKTLPEGYTRKFFTIPLQQVRAESTVQLAFLDALGLHDRVLQVSKYAVGPCWQKSLSCGGEAVDSFSNQTLQAQQREAVDVFFADCPWSYASNAPNCTVLNSLSKAVHFSASQDPAPLHSAEHIKFIAAFFNKEEEAQTIFDEKVAAMNTLRSQLPASGGDKPVVAWIEKSWDGKPKLSTANYKQLLVEYAGGKNVNASQVATTDMASFTNSLAHVDAVIDETYSSDVVNYNFNTFLTNFGINSSSELPFVKNKMVFRVDAQISGTSNLDWFETRIAHPDLAVKGLKRVLMQDILMPKKFFRNIATNETVEAINMAACTKKLVACSPSDYPETLLMINNLGAVTCSGYECGAGWNRKASMAGIICSRLGMACSDTQCCDQVTCESHTCDTGSENKASMASITCADDACTNGECCDEGISKAVESFTASAFLAFFVAMTTLC